MAGILGSSPSASDWGKKPWIKTIAARVPALLVAEIKAAKKRFNLPEDTPVVSCYEAGRDGFWLHRCLLAHGAQSHVVDSASIEINRRPRRAKSDRLDVVKLLEMLLRYRNGETKVWAVVGAPSADDEDAIVRNCLESGHRLDSNVSPDRSTG